MQPTGASECDFAQAKGFTNRQVIGARREATLLYQLVAEHYPKFRDWRTAEGKCGNRGDDAHPQMMHSFLTSNDAEIDVH